jgi:hypothetical protein
MFRRSLGDELEEIRRFDARKFFAASADLLELRAWNAVWKPTGLSQLQLRTAGRVNNTA